MDEIHQTNGRSRPSSPARWSENHETVDRTDAFEPPQRYTPDAIDGNGGSSGGAQKRKRDASGTSRSTTPTADSRNYGRDASGAGSSARLGSRRHNIGLMEDLDTDEAWFTPNTVKPRGLRPRRLDRSRAESSSGQQIETPTRLAQNRKAAEEQLCADWQPVMSDAERHRRHRLFVRSLLRLYGIGERVASTPCNRVAKRDGVSSSSLRETVPHRKRKEMEPEIVVDIDSSDESAPAAKMLDRKRSAARSKSGTPRTSRPATPPRKSLSSVLHRAIAPVALNKEHSPQLATDMEPSRSTAEVPASKQPRPATKGDTTFSDWDPFAEDLDMPASPETFIFEELSQIPDTGCRKPRATDEVAPSSSPLVARARERAKLKPPPTEEDEVFVIASQPEFTALLSGDEPVVMDTPTKTPLGVDSEDEDEADRLLMSTPGLASASKSARGGEHPSRTGIARRPLLNSMPKRTARVSASAHTSPSPAVPKERSSLSGSARNGGASADRKGKGPASPPPAKVPCPLCGQEFVNSAIEEHAATCGDGLIADPGSPPRPVPSPPPLDSKQTKLAALARKRHRKAQGRMEDDIENSSSEESDAGPSITSYFAKAQPEAKKARFTQAKSPPAPKQRNRAATSRAISDEEEVEGEVEGEEEQEPLAQCKSCGAFVARSRLRTHEAACKSKRSHEPPAPDYDDRGLLDVDEVDDWDHAPPALPRNAALPAPTYESIIPRAGAGSTSRPVSTVVHNLDPEPGADEPNPHFFWQQSAPFDLDDDVIGLGIPERDDDEQLSPLQGFENMDEEEGRLDWFNADAPASASKSTRKSRTSTPKADTASKTSKSNKWDRGGWRGGWKRGSSYKGARGGGGGRSGAGRSMPSRG
ncbi:hypothetical protein HDU87_004482 [Geranomyces variabilis]|uniref:UBZ4-type domain-containing protein n=1 Tax=Geranomyces variabilis TaxID=109894 RepID=A0AAD5XRY1_9FUNG|nr:hypothetical protein HDU87_004482 [Geranomyces variabilis]